MTVVKFYNPREKQEQLATRLDAMARALRDEAWAHPGEPPDDRKVRKARLLFWWSRRLLEGPDMGCQKK